MQESKTAVNKLAIAAYDWLLAYVPTMTVLNIMLFLTEEGEYLDPVQVVTNYLKNPEMRYGSINAIQDHIHYLIRNDLFNRKRGYENEFEEMITPEKFDERIKAWLVGSIVEFDPQALKRNEPWYMTALHFARYQAYYEGQVAKSPKGFEVLGHNCAYYNGTKMSFKRETLKTLRAGIPYIRIYHNAHTDRGIGWEKVVTRGRPFTYSSRFSDRVDYKVMEICKYGKGRDYSSYVSDLGLTGRSSVFFVRDTARNRKLLNLLSSSNVVDVFRFFCDKGRDTKEHAMIEYRSAFISKQTDDESFRQEAAYYAARDDHYEDTYESPVVRVDMEG